MRIISFEFLIFFAVTAAMYWLLPARLRCTWLCAASLFFYFTQGIASGFFLLFFLGVSWGGALWMEGSASPSGRRLALFLSVSCELGGLLWFKYIGFFSGGRLRSPILLAGISFYIFRMLSYLWDVYRGTIRPERDLVRYALYASFFPIMLAGPIERAGHLLPQFAQEHQAGLSFDPARARDGLVRMLWGVFCKLVLADRIKIAVDAVYASYPSYGGAVLALAALLYPMQLYLDFGGYSSIAVGASRVLGIEIMENFDAPYLSRSIGAFWRRWHISLTAWFRDYVYIPLGGSRGGQGRRIRNLLVVFTLSGLWHGADWNYLVWGLLQGLYQTAAILSRPLRARLRQGLRIEEDDQTLCLLQIGGTYLLISFSEIFFRMPTLGGAVAVIRGLARPMLWQLTDGTLLRLGVNAVEWRALLLGLLLVLAVDVLHARGIKLGTWLSGQSILLRWPVWILGVVAVAVCGVWGPGYDASSFVYYQF